MMNNRIPTLKPYPAYKDSGVAWLGKVPAHWKLLPHRALFQEMNERNHPDEPLLSVTIARGVIPQEVLLANSSKKDSSNLDKSNYKLVQPGDITYNKMRAWQGALGVSQYCGIVSPAYIVVQPRLKQVPRYYHYLFRTPAFTSEAERWSYGITSDQWSLRFVDFKRIYGILPPLGEQVQIVRFLDHHDRLTRHYIRAQRRLIELLTEQKQALIQQAVIRGLDPHVKLKPSGIEWLGEIPEHWEVRRLKFWTSHIVDCLHATPKYVANGKHPAIRTADVKVGRVDIVHAKHVNQEQYMLWASRLVPQAGDILYTREGERYGLAALVPENVALCISQRMMLFRIHKPYRSDFLMWQLNCPHVYAQAAADVIGATSPHVNIERIRNYVLVVPPPDEQEKIAASVEIQCKTLEMLQVGVSREIDLIHEYRTRLIADVVTGKLDVRDVSLPAPDDLDGLEEDAELDALDVEEMDDADA